MLNLDASMLTLSCILTGTATLIVWHVTRFYVRVWRHPRGPFPWPIVGNLLENMRKEKGDHDIIFEDAGPPWRALRKVAIAAVRKHHSSENLEALCSEVVDAYVDSLKGTSEITDARDPLLFIIFNITAASTFSTKFERNSPDLAELASINRGLPDMSPLQSDIAPWLGVLHWRKERAFRRHMANLIALFSRLYDKAKADYVQGLKFNFVHALLAAKEDAIEQDKEDAVHLTERNMMHVVLNLFEAGMNTSVSATDWLFLELVRNPDIQKKVQEEIQTNIGERPPKMQDREKLPFTMACVLEVLRLYPPALLGLHRRAQSAERLGKCSLL